MRVDRPKPLPKSASKNRTIDHEMAKDVQAEVAIWERENLSHLPDPFLQAQSLNQVQKLERLTHDHGHRQNDRHPRRLLKSKSKRRKGLCQLLESEKTFPISSALPLT